MSTKHVFLEDLEKEFGALTFGSLLRAHRMGEEMTQVELAKQLGLSKQNLNDMEHGRRLPSLRRAVKIAKKIGQLEALMIQLVLQDQVNREKLKYKVSIDADSKKMRLKLNRINHQTSNRILGG